MNASDLALAKSVGTYDSRTGRLKWESTAIETLTAGPNKDIWFKGKDLATALGYKAAKVAVHDRVDAVKSLALGCCTHITIYASSGRDCHLNHQ